MSQPSALAIREFLRQSAERDPWTGKDVEKGLGVNAATAKTVLATLQISGYIEAAGTGKYRITDAGKAMAKVKAGRPVKRATAQQKLDEFMDRLRAVNTDPHYLYKVEKAVLFGPFLTNKEREQIKDVDIAIQLAPKIKNKTRLEDQVRSRVEGAKATGKKFKSYAAESHYGETEVREFLKSRSQAIALYEMGDWVLQQPHKDLV